MTEKARWSEFSTVAFRRQCRMGRDCCPHAGCFLCGTKCGSGRVGSGDCCREEVCQVQRFVIHLYFYSGRGCRVSWPIGGRRSSFYYRDWQKNDFQHRGSARNGVVPTHGDLTLQRRVSCKHFHLRSVVVIPDIIIFIVIIVVVVIIIIIIIISDPI